MSRRLQSSSGRLSSIERIGSQKLQDATIELAVPLVPRADTELPLPELWDAVKGVFPKTLAGLIAAAALAYNAWMAGIFNSGHPLPEGSARFFLVVLIQAVAVCYVVVISSALAVDVAAGVLTGTIVIIIGDVAGAFRGPFDVWQLIAQLVIGYAAVLGLAAGFAFLRTRRLASAHTAAARSQGPPSPGAAEAEGAGPGAPRA